MPSELSNDLHSLSGVVQFGAAVIRLVVRRGITHEEGHSLLEMAAAQRATIEALRAEEKDRQLMEQFANELQAMKAQYVRHGSLSGPLIDIAPDGETVQ